MVAVVSAFPRPRAALTVGCALFALTTGCGGKRHVTTEGSVGDVAWSRDGRSIAWGEGIRGTGRERVWVARADGSEPRALTAAIDSLGQIAWLPRRRLLYWANFRLFVLRPGRSATEISSYGGDKFALDASGTRLATGDPPCSTGCDGGVIVFGVDGHVIRRLSRNTQSTSPTFSPDGRRVAFARNLCDRSGRCERPVGIWIASVATGRLNRLTKRGGSPSWSPDGARIAYVDTGYPGRSPTASLRVVSAGGGRSRTLLRAPVYGVGSTAWAPDSRRLAVVAGRPSRLLIVDLSTRRVYAVRMNATSEPVLVVWSPDSSKLLVTTRPAQQSCLSLWLVRADGSSARLLRHC